MITEVAFHIELDEYLDANQDYCSEFIYHIYVINDSDTILHVKITELETDNVECYFYDKDCNLNQTLFNLFQFTDKEEKLFDNIIGYMNEIYKNSNNILSEEYKEKWLKSFNDLKKSLELKPNDKNSLNTLMHNYIYKQPHSSSRLAISYNKDNESYLQLSETTKLSGDESEIDELVFIHDGKKEYAENFFLDHIKFSNFISSELDFNCGNIYSLLFDYFDTNHQDKKNKEIIKVLMYHIGNI